MTPNAHSKTDRPLPRRYLFAEDLGETFVEEKAAEQKVRCPQSRLDCCRLLVLPGVADLAQLIERRQ